MSKKEAIVSAALELIARNGVHATPMSAIAKVAGTGMGTIYNYYATKEILLNAIYTSIKQQEERLFDSFSTDQNIKTQFENYYSTSVAFFIENPLYFRFMEQLHASPIITEVSKQAGQKSMDCVYELIASGQQNNSIKNMAQAELMQFIGGSVFSYVSWYLSGAGDRKTPLSNQLQLVWDAIKN